MVKVRYIGDGEHYVLGRPAIEGTIEEVDAETADSLEATGLYERVSKSAKKAEEADGAAGGEPA